MKNASIHWNCQREVCTAVNAEFAPFAADRMIVILDGVYEGDSVDGVRYPSPPPMSGWWLTTDRYNGDIDSLKVVHAYHVTVRRPDLAKFFGLPDGYRFASLEGEVWFDEEVANSPP